MKIIGCDFQHCYYLKARMKVTAFLLHIHLPSSPVLRSLPNRIYSKLLGAVAVIQSTVAPPKSCAHDPLRAGDFLRGDNFRGAPVGMTRAKSIGEKTLTNRLSRSFDSAALRSGFRLQAPARLCLAHACTTAQLSPVCRWRSSLLPRFCLRHRRMPVQNGRSRE